MYSYVFIVVYTKLGSNTYRLKRRHVSAHISYRQTIKHVLVNLKQRRHALTSIRCVNWADTQPRNSELTDMLKLKFISQSYCILLRVYSRQDMVSQPAGGSDVLPIMEGHCECVKKKKNRQNGQAHCLGGRVTIVSI